MSTAKKKPHPQPSFSEFVTDLDHGQIDQKVTHELYRVVQAVEETGLVGELTLKFKIKKEGDKAIVALDLKSKAPKHPYHATLFYFGQNGELLKEDPRQLSFTDLPKPNLKSVDDDE